jgi:hypothetical protein
VWTVSEPKSLSREELERALSAVQHADAARVADAIRAHIAALEAQLVSAQHEVAKTDAVLRVVAPELIARLTSSCVWCGEEPPSGLDPEALKLHIREHLTTCPLHPMRALEKERDANAQSAVNAVRDREAALANYAALLAAGNRIHDLAQHDEACRMLVGDDFAMCDCAIGDWQQVQREPHPGAALLEEHRKALKDAEVRGYARCTDDMQKALVRARNEGLEKAADQCNYSSNYAARKASRKTTPAVDAPAWLKASEMARQCAAAIRAMKEPVPCCERDTNGDGNCDRHQRCES